MKRFYLVPLAVYTFIFTSNSSCMMLRLIKGNALQPIATQKRFCSTSILKRKIEAVEKRQDMHTKEITELKAIIATLQSNRSNGYQTPTYENLRSIHYHDTYIDTHNMHYGNTNH